MKTLLALALGIGTFILEGCSPSPEVRQSSSAEPPINLDDGPIVVTLRQRSEAAIPGSSRELRIRIGDITRGQVQTTIVGESGDSGIAGPQSISVGEGLAFHMHGYEYEVTLIDLANALIGEDFASFRVSEVQDNSVTEKQKILLLIASVRELKDAIFIRNGREYNSMEAAEHLQRKWEMERDRIQTAQEFIHGIATASSISGAPYRIRLPDGREVESASYLKEELREIEAGTYKDQPN